ncbi:hypothetical protein MMC28_001761 [Mycoblastus sanguinarius]|nr:hypothetical protein [Mycoblastus sanguinarius]
MEAAVTTTNTAVAEPATKLSVIARKKRKIKPSLVAATERTNRADKDAQETLLCVKNALGPELFKSLSSLKARNSPSPKAATALKRIVELTKTQKNWTEDLDDSLPDSSSSPSEDTTTRKDMTISVSDCQLFTKIPAEIRQMIFQHLLISSEPISRAHKLIGCKHTALLDSYQPISDIDAAVVRTCRMIYEETTPILYGRNKFEFHGPDVIAAFQSDGMSQRHPLGFGLKRAPYGRLTLLRNVYLKFEADRHLSRFIGNPGNRRHPPDRDFVWRDWSRTVFSEDRSTYSPPLGFPALENLTIDFSDWELAESEGLLVKPFIKKFGEAGKLQNLVIKGVKHEATLGKLREGLVKEGGVFHAENQ